jgi:hypothetical protein
VYWGSLALLVIAVPLGTPYIHTVGPVAFAPTQTLPMNSTVHPLLQLAARLVAEEVREPAGGEVQNNSASERVCDKLGAQITKLAGAAGYRSLLLRALSLAQAECPQLSSVVVLPDGSLAGLPETTLARGPSGQEEAGTVLVANLLGLLNLFIGSSLTRQLVGQAWPSVLNPSDIPSKLPLT